MWGRAGGEEKEGESRGGFTLDHLHKSANLGTDVGTVLFKDIFL